MLEKKIVLTVAIVAAAAAAYLGYAIYKEYPKTITNNKSEGAEG